MVRPFVLSAAVTLLSVSPLFAASLDSRAAVAAENFNRASETATGASPVVLFDNAHAETAGNADWTITGAYSDFAVTLRHHGFLVNSFDRGQLSAAALSGVAVLILPEPNHRLDSGEISAIQDFVQKGGGLFAIGDHAGSDRDNDGWDSPMILNELVPVMGIRFNGDKFDEAPIAARFAPGDIGKGVRALGAWGANSLSVSAGAKVELTYGPRHRSKPYVASNGYGGGRVVVIGDSSPFDDGTGTPGKHLYPEYNNAQYGIPQFSLNVVNWLAHRSQESVDLEDSVK